MKALYRLLFIGHILVGIGALAGGLSAVINPFNPFGGLIDISNHSLFTNYFVPGIILLCIGIVNILSIYTSYFNTRYHGYISSVCGFAFFIWVDIQLVMINTVTLLHAILLSIAITQVIVSMVIIFRHDLFPANIVIKFYISMRNRVNRRFTS